MAQLAQGTHATRVRILTHKSFRRNRQRTFSVAAIVYCLATCLCSGRTAHAQVSSAPVPETQPLIEIVVTARRMALVTATELKRNSDTIVDSIVADEAGKLPDTSVTEVLQRVPQIAVCLREIGAKLRRPTKTRRCVGRLTKIIERIPQVVMRLRKRRSNL